MGLVNHWHPIADNLRKADWTCRRISAVIREGRIIWIVDAHRGDGNHFVVPADEKLAEFLELESAICKIALTLHLGRWQSRARVKSVGRLHRELHPTLFPQGQP